MLNVLHINQSDISGGAARAAYRIHQALGQNEPLYSIQSQMRVLHKLSDDPTVTGGFFNGNNPIWRRIRPRLIHQRYRNFETQNPTPHSIAWLATGLGKE